MKKLCIFLTTTMLICLLAACGGKEETAQSDILYAVFGSENVKEYTIEYTGAQKNAEELAHELSELTGLDFNITASKSEDGWIVDWAADSTLVAGLDDRVQKDEFFFFDNNTLSWFMMDSLYRTLSENLDAKNIYYTMKGGEKLVLREVYPINEFSSDVPYMGSEFYFSHSNVQGDEENLYARAKGLWRLDGMTNTASIEMDEFGRFTMYTASGSVEASGHIECIDENETGDYRYDLYNSENKLIVSFYFDSDTQFHLEENDNSVYLLDMWTSYRGLWEYPDGTVLELNDVGWNLYKADELTLIASGPLKFEGEFAYLMNADGSSGGGRISINEDGNLIDSGDVLFRE